MKATHENVTAVMKGIPAGQMFSVYFTKRTDGSDRKLTCRKGVTKYLRGGELSYEPNDKGLVIVWSPDSKGKHGEHDVGYRAIPTEGVYKIVGNHVEYLFETE